MKDHYGFALLLAAALGCPAVNAQDETAVASDAAFVLEAAGAGLAEVDLGRLAAERGNGALVRSFGQMMVDDHGKANAELASLAARKRLSLPGATPETARAEWEQLNNLTGVQFDGAYLRAMVTVHERALALFEREAREGSDPDLRAWAAKSLPAVRGHLSTATNIQPRYLR